MGRSGRPVTELLARASARHQVTPADGKSSSVFERVTVDGRGYFLKRLSPASDWIMRATGDHVHRPYLVWRAGVMDRTPACIDHTVVAMEVEGTGDTAVLSVLMNDVGACLVPEGDAVVPLVQHGGFIDHLAELSVTFWGWRDSIGGLTTTAQRMRFFAPDNIAPELDADVVPGPVSAAATGWLRLPDRSPFLARVTGALHEHPELVTGPLGPTPVTFLQGDWKMGNLGTHPEGRTILLDWAYPGAGPACWDLWWYVALNRARLPETKEETLARFRSALERRGVATESWWERQLDLTLLGIMATFGWEKALGDDEELAWWERRVAEAVQDQDVALS